MTKNSYHFILLTLGVLALNACAQMQAPEANNLSVRNDTGVITPMTPMRQGNQIASQTGNQKGNQSVSIFDMPQGYDNGAAFTGSGLASNNGGMIMPNNSSVTIFPVDGTMAAGIPQYDRAQNLNAAYSGAPYLGGSYGVRNNMMGHSNRASDNRIYFKDGSSRLGSIDRQRIRSAAEKAKFGPSIVSIEGHASRPTQAGTGTVESHILNLKESMNRSFAVSKQLMRDGVPGEKIKTVSWGSARATGDNNHDRRVDINMGAAY